MVIERSNSGWIRVAVAVACEAWIEVPVELKKTDLADRRGSEAVSNPFQSAKSVFLAAEYCLNILCVAKEVRCVSGVDFFL